MKLSENFSLQELIKSQTALRKGINNKPASPDIVVNLQTLVRRCYNQSEIISVNQ